MENVNRKKRRSNKNKRTIKRKQRQTQLEPNLIEKKTGIDSLKS